MYLQPLMRLFSIRVRMLGAIGVVLLLLGIVGGAGLWGMSRQSAVSHEFVGHAFEETLTLSRLRVALSDMSRHEKDMVIQYESPEQMSLANLQWEKAREEVNKEIAHMMQGDADEDNAVLLEMQKRLNDYVAAVEPVVAQIKSGGYDSATVANRMLGRAHELGQIKEGYCADIALFRTDTLSMAGGAVHDPVGALLLCASDNADYTIVNGRVVVRQGEITTVDMGPLIERHNQLAMQLALG